VEIKRAQTELERLRASDVVKATITRESKQQAADAKYYEEEKIANAGKSSKYPMTVQTISQNFANVVSNEMRNYPEVIH
jgi:hypothetical protein